LTNIPRKKARLPKETQTPKDSSQPTANDVNQYKKWPKTKQHRPGKKEIAVRKLIRKNDIDEKKAKMADRVEEKRFS
jgi:hypothetical protein